MSNGRSEAGTGGAPPSKSKGRAGSSSGSAPSAEGFSLSAPLGGSSSLPHAGHEEVPDETNPQIGHSYTLLAVGFHASRCRKS